MRQVVPIALLATTASAAFQLPFISTLWPSKSILEINEAIRPTSPRIAVIGAGAGGSSAAFWIAKARERHGLDVEIDIYERNTYIGGSKSQSVRPSVTAMCELTNTFFNLAGSTTVYPYNDRSYEPVELGASIFVEINKNMWRASEEFNLSRFAFNDPQGVQGETAFWDGDKFVFTVIFSSFHLSSPLSSHVARLRFWYLWFLA